MALSLSKKVLLSFISAVALFLSAMIWFTSPVSKTNANIVTGVFNSIIRNESRGDISYVVRLNGDDHEYKIVADWSRCFNYDSFQKEVNSGQTVKLYINKGFSFSSVPQVISLSSNNEEYLSQECINQKISDNKVIMPLVFAVCVLIISFLFYSKNRKRAIRKPRGRSQST